MYLYDKNRITYFAETDRRNKRIPFGIKADDRTRHMYIIGKTGMGKSTCIENMVVQDIKNGEGFAFIDPHGKSAALLLDYIPEDRIKDVIYFAPFDVDYPVSFNVMEDVGADKRHLVANGLLSAFKKIWGPETFSARMEYILMNALLALLEYPESTLLGVSRLLTDKAYRKKVVDNIKDPSVKTYWVEEFAKYSETYVKDAVPGVQNKLGQFTSNPLIRNIIGQPHSSFNIRQMMDERKILIVNLSKGQLGEGNANLLGGMIITKIYLAAMSRADLTEAELKRLPNFYMYVDEFQSFANESFADILSEARKYKLALIMAHQYIEQMDEKVRAAVFGNVGTQIMFRVGATDAEVLEKEYAPVFTAEDMVNLGFTQIYLKLMIDGVASHPFSAVTLPPIAPLPGSLRNEVIASSRKLFGKPRESVEREIAAWFESGSSAGSEEGTGKERDERPRPPRSDYPPREPRTEYPPRAPRADYPPREARPADFSPRREASRPESTFARFDRPDRPERSERPREPREQREPQVQREQHAPYPARTQQSLQPRESLVPEKTEKPFAKAFQNLTKELPREEKPEVRAPEKIPLASLAKVAPERTPVLTQKSKGPSPENLNSLKSALAGVLKEKESEQKKPIVPEVKPQTPAPQPQTSQTASVVLQEMPLAQPAPAPVAPQPQVPPPQIPQPPVREEIPQQPPIREVPEDVLTAILRGED